MNIFCKINFFSKIFGLGIFSLCPFEWGWKFALSFSSDLLAFSVPHFSPFFSPSLFLLICDTFPSPASKSSLTKSSETICMPWTNIFASELNYFRLNRREGDYEGGININIWCDLPANLLCQMHHKHSTQTRAHLLGCLSSLASFHSIFYIKNTDVGEGGSPPFKCNSSSPVIKSKI